LENLCRKTLSTELTAVSHKARFALLLQLEEVQMEVDIQKYDLFGVLLGRYKANSRLLTLEVPALFCGLLSGPHYIKSLSKCTGPGIFDYQ